MIPAHTPVGTVVVLWSADAQVFVRSVRSIVSGYVDGSFSVKLEPDGLLVHPSHIYALDDLVAQALWNGADVFKALGVNLGDDAKRLQNQAAMWRQACEQDRPLESIMRAAGRDEDLRELEALREKAAKWDALSKPSNMPIISMPPDPVPDLAKAAERIAVACEAINANIQKVILENTNGAWLKVTE